MIAGILFFFLFCAVMGGLNDLFSGPSKPQWSAETLRKSEALKERMAAKALAPVASRNEVHFESDPTKWASAR